MKEKIYMFIEKVKTESNDKKFLEMDLINEMISFFNGNFEKKDYSIKIKNPLDVALQFYKDYNEEYYKIIVDGIREQKIIIDKNISKPYVDTKKNEAYIKLNGNDGDMFILVHEFAHYIDRNSNPRIIPDEFYFLAEVFSFYIEKQLEQWLDVNNYGNLISIKRNNRMFYESKMLKVIKNQLYYENLYKEKGSISESDISTMEMKEIMQYDSSGVSIVNYLLMYPLANILSQYLVDMNLVKCDFELCKICLDFNIYEVLASYSFRKSKLM